MRRKTAGDFHPAVLEAFDEYVHGLIDRRGFLLKAAKYAVGGVTASMLLDALNPQFAAAQQVPADDRRLSRRYVQFNSPKGYGTMRGHLVAPAKPAGKLPAVLVAHENRGLNPHIEDIARRLALGGFLAFAPDALQPYGGYPGDEDKARELFQKLDQDKSTEDFVAAADFLAKQPESRPKIGVVGFCWGGGIANVLATRLPGLGATVPFYGPAPAVADVPKIRAPLLLHFAENDPRINAGWPAYEAALQAAGISYVAHHYPGTQHGFNNDTTPRYDAAAAALAWQRTIDFFRKNLKA